MVILGCQKMRSDAQNAEQRQQHKTHAGGEGEPYWRSPLWLLHVYVLVHLLCSAKLSMILVPMDTLRPEDGQSCSQCGQVITLIHPLPSHVRCPRCGFKLRVADIVSVSTPLMAVPSSAPPSSRREHNHRLEHPLPPDVVPVPLIETGLPGPSLQFPSNRLSKLPLAAAGGGAQRAAHGVSAFGYGVLGASEAIDRVFDGYRLRSLVGALGIAGMSLALNRVVESRAVELVATLSGILLLYLVWLMAFAFVGNLRDATGRWSGSVVVERLAAFVRGVWAEIETIGDAPVHIRWRLAMTVGSVLTLGTFAFANILVVIMRGVGDLAGKKDLVAATEAAAAYGWLGALVTGLVGVGWWRSLPTTRAIETFDNDEARELTSQLPAIVTLNAGKPPPKGDTFLHELLEVFATWRPRTWPTEADYQLALKRHLERKLPGVSIEREKRVGPSRSHGIADFLIGDAVILELKKGFRKSAEIDRAMGQMDKYAVGHPDKPALLVIFEAVDADILDAPVTPRLVAMHTQKAAITVRMPVSSRVSG
jgi:hypothetical protein